MIPTVVDTILRAMGAAMPERAVAAHHGMTASIRSLG